MYWQSYLSINADGGIVLMRILRMAHINWLTNSLSLFLSFFVKRLVNTPTPTFQISKILLATPVRPAL